jgi:hypothetical protein
MENKIPQGRTGKRFERPVKRGAVSAKAGPVSSGRSLRRER